MEGFPAYNQNPNSGSPPPEVMLAECNPKKRAGRKKFKETRHPIYRGIRQRSSDKWVCELREPNKKTRIWLGTYPTAEMAARAHDVAAIAFRGRSACLNYADSAWRLPVPASTETKDIQRAAAEAAELFRPGFQAPEAAASSSAEEAVVVEEERLDWRDEERLDWRDEEFFGMPELVADMYNGMMLPPPQLDYADISNADMYDDTDMPLWNF